MPISYLRATFPRQLPDANAQKLFAYILRKNVVDQTGRHFAFAGIAADLVYQAVLIPPAAPAEFADPIHLAREIDAIEARRKQKPRKKKQKSPNGQPRYRQVAAAFVAALPPDAVMTYDEVVELAHRLADYIRGDLPIAICIAIHDPALETPHALNRHAHLLATTRVMDASGFSTRKVREVFARPRRAGGQTYVAEGVVWPRIYSEILTSFFSELGLDVTVAPHLPIGHRHWSPTEWRYQRQRVAEHRRTVDKLNLSIILGPGDSLVDRMLRGRSTMHIAELRQLLAKVIDNEGLRAHRLSEILADPNLLTLAVHRDDRRPARVTTRAIHELITAAVTLVARQQGFLCVAAGTNSDETTAALVDRIARTQHGRLILVGQAQSHCDPLVNKLPNTEHTIVTTEKLVPLLNAPFAPDARISAGDLIVLPCAEQIHDRWLAATILVAAERGARLVLGYDRSWRSGIVFSRLAAWVVEKLDPPQTMLSDADLPQELRRGRVAQVITSLAERGILQFAGHSSTGPAPDFVVCDRIGEVEKGAQKINLSNETGLEHGPYRFFVGEWIAFTKTDYSMVPPDIRAGRLAQIAYILPEGRTIVVLREDGVLLEIDLTHYPHVRPAWVISLREARHTPIEAHLLIKLTVAKHAWACILVAAARVTNVLVEVAPEIATAPFQLIQAVERSLPSALPGELIEMRDPDAVFVAALTQSNAAGNPPPTTDDPDVTLELEYFPEEANQASNLLQALHQPSLLRGTHAEAIVTAIPRHLLHQQIWTVLGSTTGGQAFVNHLDNLRNDPNGGQISQELLKLYGDTGPMQALIRAAIEPPQPADLPPQTQEEEADAPGELQELRPRDWSSWDLWKFATDIQLFNLKLPHWDRALGPSDSDDSDTLDAPLDGV